MELIPDWAPNIHPILVHFPIGILLVAAFLDLLNLFVPDKWWDDLKSTILYGIGTFTAIIAYYTGSWAADSVFLPAEAQSVLNNHADWALWTVWFFILYTLLRIAFHWLDIMKKENLQVCCLHHRSSRLVSTLPNRRPWSQNGIWLWCRNRPAAGTAGTKNLFNRFTVSKRYFFFSDW
ncbi:MAG: DUF2231 domain-containing protein [Balneolaceae bacterium]|nr:DUF2231 domain-containing protein [Balneolaceae bacterium]